MNNIWKSAKLDFSLVKPYVKTICFTMVLPIVFAAINRSLLTGISFAMCFIAMTTGYTFSVTEKNSMERLYGILPIRKSDMVIGRYIFIIIMGLAALLFSLVAHPILLTILGETISKFDFISAAATGIFLFALYTVFQLPGYYKLGSIKGRVFMYIPVAGFLITLLLITKIPVGESKLLFTVINSPLLLMLLTFILVIAMYVVSIFVSIKILKNKET
ncbi:MAG: ABC-2 transporter permease [Lachnospiraceae bacterium]|nr:ABC-2 transporter permease [Lachnospiraceae bacterium]